MPTSTSNFGFNKPLVNDPIDEDLWGGQLNTNWDSIDTILDAMTPLGTLHTYTGITAPNSRWLLADGTAISRTTYSAYFALIGTAFGSGDGSTTFNLYDSRGRVEVGLDNLGGSSANRITNSNADSLNSTGMGDETPNVTINSVTLSVSNMPAHSHRSGIADSSAQLAVYSTTTSDMPGSATQTISHDAAGRTNQAVTSSVGSTSSFTPTAINTAGDNLQSSVAMGKIIRVL